MGYCVDMNVTIEVKDEQGCLAAINRMHHPDVVEKNGSGGCYSGGEKRETWYSWVRNPGPDGFGSLEDAFYEWRYECAKDGDGFQVYAFAGDKWGDDEQLFLAIAPFCEGEIYIHGEDGNSWGYRMKFGDPLIYLTMTWTEEG